MQSLSGAPPSEGRQITFLDPIHFIIEAIHPGNVIFDETGEIPALPSGGSAPRKKSYILGHLKPLCDHIGSEYIGRAIYKFCTAKYK